MSLEPTNPESSPIPAAPARPVPAPKKMRVWPLVLAVSALTCLSGGALVAAGVAFQTMGKPLEVTQEDRTLLVTTEDLAARVEGFESQPQVEKLSKKQGLDGAIELEYEYDPTEGGLYLSSSVTTERTPSSASTTYASLRVGHGVGFSMSADKKTKMEERDELFAWGDESRHALITHDGKPVGNLFVTRKGRHIYSFMVVGVYFDTQETLGDLLLPKLEQLAQRR